MIVLIPVLAFVTVITIGAGIAVAIHSRPTVASRLLATDGTTLAPRERRRWTSAMLSRFGNAFSFGHASSELHRKLSRAGYNGEGAVTAYLGIKLLLLVVGLLGMAILIVPLEWSLFAKAYAIIAVAAFLYFVPNIVLRARLSARSRAVRQHLPDAVDLLEVCVSSGMGLDMAWNAVGDEMQRVSTILADEMALTNLEVQLGASRTDALRHMSDRTGAPECTSLVAMLGQSDRFGTSVSEALATFATSMRESRSQRAEEGAEKMAVKLLFPLVLFIFPVMLVVMVGPTAITLFRIMSS